MSRLRRLKEKIIKATACGLALSLAIGSIQGLGTYALFTDTEDVASELAISTGDVDVQLSSKNDNTNSEFNGKTYTKKFTITNNGTLKQNIKLNLNIILGSDLTGDWIESYGIQFDQTDNVESISNLSYGVDVYLKDNTTKDFFVLNPGETITATISIQTKNLTESEKSQLAGKSFDLKLKVTALQIGHENITGNGFYDIEFRTDKFIITPMIFGIMFKDNQATREYITINFSNFIDNPISVELKKSSGGLSRDLEWGLSSNNSLDIKADVYNTMNGDWYINNTFTDQHYLIFEFKYTNETRYFKFEFKKGANSTSNNPKVDVKIVEVDSSSVVLSETEVLESLNEEIEVLSEAEVAELPKEEVEKITEPEVIEIQEEETIEILSLPQVIETPKADEDIQE